MTHKTPEQVARDILEINLCTGPRRDDVGLVKLISEALREAYANGRRDGMEEASARITKLEFSLKEISCETKYHERETVTHESAGCWMCIINRMARDGLENNKC